MSEQPPQSPGSPQPPPSGGEPGTPTPPPPSAQQPGGYGAPPPGPGPQPGGYAAYGAQPAGYGPGAMRPEDERTWGMLAHVSAILGALVALSFIGPLIVLLVQGQKSQFVRRQAVEALNFQITTYIAAIVSFVLIFVLIGFILLPIVGILWLVLTIMAAVAANRGEDYRYPFNIRLIK